METTESTLVPALIAPDLDSFVVRQAIAGFLAGYGETTREAYGLDLRRWLAWCASHELGVFEVRRAHIELFARWLEHEGKARATVARRLSMIAGFYRYCVEEQLLPVSPATHVRRPEVSYESNATGLDRNELGMFLVQAGLCGGRDHALACLLALNGIRTSEALNADIEHLDFGKGASHPDDHPQGRQGRHHPVGAAHGSGDRPLCRGTRRRSDPVEPGR
jgi:site-specific recombinase XerD